MLVGTYLSSEKVRFVRFISAIRLLFTGNPLSRNDPFWEAYDKASRRNPTGRRTAEDDLIDCVGKKVVDVIASKWDSTARVIFDDGSEIEFKAQREGYHKMHWRLKT